MKKAAEKFLKSKGHDYGSLVGESDSSLISGGTIVDLMVGFLESQAPNKGMISEISYEYYSKLFDEWVDGWDTSENVKEHLKGQKSFYERFNKWMRSKLSPQETSDNWVSVEDELPTQSVEVLAINNARNINIAHYHSFRWYSSRDLERFAKVTHWQPLPKTPKPKDIQK